MNTLLNYKLIISSIGGVLGVLLGGMDGLIYALVAFSVIDYVCNW